MIFNRENFSTQLTLARKKAKMSQQKFAEHIAAQLSLFVSTDQSTVSKWEQQKQEPSLKKRIAIANLLEHEYQLSRDEAAALRLELQNKLQFDKFESLYPYSPTEVRRQPLKSLDEAQYEMVCHAHYKVAGEKLAKTLSLTSQKECDVVCALVNNVLLGHYIVTSTTNDKLVVSFVASNFATTQALFRSLFNEVCDELIIPAQTPMLENYLAQREFKRLAFDSKIAFFGASKQTFLSDELINYYMSTKDDSLLRALFLT